MPTIPRRPRKRVVFLDLDDTVVDTFERIIKIQEAHVAELIAARLQSDRPLCPAEIAAEALRLRRRDPASLERWTISLLPAAGEELVELRRAGLARVPLGGLRLTAGQRRMLAKLARSHRLILLTEGLPDLQLRKIRRLRLAPYFERIEIVDPMEGGDKEQVLRRWVSGDRDSQMPVVVGNRLDREIAAGARLGLPTIWIRKGEGGLRPLRPLDPRPTLTIRDIGQLPGALRRLPRR
jgi:FMN phosphatase YigB (HAD superfamily)